MRVLGLMSGTSLDGVDAAILDTDGRDIGGFGPCATFDYEAVERAVVERAVVDALAWGGDGVPPASFAAASAVILTTHARAVKRMMAQSGPVDLIGLHGQTVLHLPDRRLTVQLGSPEELAEATGIGVVSDMRLADMVAGGQGAPLVPVYHAALVRKLGLERPVAFLNIGGVANITWIGGDDGDMLAYDVGPGNGLIDQLVASHGLGSYDAGGRLGMAGTVSDKALTALMAHPYFARSGPRSLDRYDFTLDAVSGLCVEDAAATLAAFTAAAVAHAAMAFPEPARIWLVCGGGRYNGAIMRELSKRLDADCVPADELGLRGDAIEAEAIAFLAARSLSGLPLTYPATTGVSAPLSGGRYVPAPAIAYLDLSSV